MERNHITVTAGIIYNSNNPILIAQRRMDKSLGGFWEFPGGKIEPGETPRETLKREIWEEFDIDIDVTDDLFKTEYSYPNFDLTMYVCSAVWKGQGQIKICDHEQYKFITPDALDKYTFAPADISVIQYLQKNK